MRLPRDIVLIFIFNPSSPGSQLLPASWCACPPSIAPVTPVASLRDHYRQCCRVCARQRPAERPSSKHAPTDSLLLCSRLAAASVWRDQTAAGHGGHDYGHLRARFNSNHQLSSTLRVKAASSLGTMAPSPINQSCTAAQREYANSDVATSLVLDKRLRIKRFDTRLEGRPSKY